MNNEAEATYIIAAGGTGGHIFPGIAIAREIRSRRPSATVVFVGTRHGLEQKLIPAHGFPLATIRASGFAGKGLRKKLAALGALPLGMLDAWKLLRRSRPRVVAGLGAYVSVPVLAAARMLGIPTVIHESNAMPGMANRFASRFATRVAVTYPAANGRLARPGVLTGTPVRSEFFAAPPLVEAPSSLRLLVFGGSQGSIVLNRAVVEAWPELRSAGVELILQTGEKHLGEISLRLTADQTAGTALRLEAFLPKLHEELAWADLVVSRAGAMTVAELAAAGRPAILVPFGSATHGHQRENARALIEAGAAIMIEERELTGGLLARTARELLADRARLMAMGQAARRLARPDAARRLADLLFEAESGGGGTP